MSINHLLGIARSALTAHQAALQVTSHNLANAQTEGYSRQRVTLSAGQPVRGATGLLGTGVAVDDVMRMRDTLLDTQYRREAGNAAEFGLRRDLLGQVEEIFGELSETGFGSTLDAFWSAWSDVAGDVTKGSVRGLVKQNGQQLAYALTNFAHRLEGVRASAGERLGHALRDVNQLAHQVGELNRQITALERTGQSAPDLRDQRDRVLDAMSELAPVQIIERSDRSFAVFLGTATLDDGGETREITLDDATGQLRVGSSPVVEPGGTLGALIDLREREIPAVGAQLDAFARALVETVNSLHNSPAPPAIGTGLDFFDPTRTTAATIALSDDIADPGRIALVSGAPSDNRVALALAALREAPVTFTVERPDGTAEGVTKSFGSFFVGLVSDVGVRVHSADRSATVYETLRNQADTRRASVSGVLTDEELIQLMRHPQAYTAATRLVKVADELAQAILQMV
jgi:flagellar hook-associated protein 1 FlgK